MKKTSARPSLHPLFFLFILVLFLVTYLSSCEMHSLSGGQQQTIESGTLPAMLTPTTEMPLPGTTPPGDATTTPPITMPPPVTTQPVPTAIHPLTGLPCQASSATVRPFAFTVDRASGLAISSAEIVIEGVTEGERTRLSLIGTDHTSHIGGLTIASTRPYLAAISHDFFAISVYRGTADDGRPSMSFLYDTVDLSAYPHTVTEADIRESVRAAGYQTSVVEKIELPYTLTPMGSVKVPEGTASSYASIPFSGGTTTAFTYDSLSNRYTMRSSAALAPVGSELPSFSNLIVLFHDSTRHVTKDGVELTLDTARGGHGYFLTAGIAVPISWQRDPETSALRLLDKDGAVLTVNRGKTYVALTTYEAREALILN